MRPPTPLPDELDAAVFTVTQARAAGVGYGRLRGRDLRRPHRGARSQGPPPADILGAARELAAVIDVPFAFGHETACHLLGLPLPKPWSADDDLHVVTPSSAPVIRRPGVVGHRGLDLRPGVVLEGLAVVDGPATWADMATSLPLDPLVVLGDAVVGGFEPEYAVEDLAASVRRGMRGCRRARRALELIRPGSVSPMETLTRLALVRAKLPEPRLNADLIDGQGHFVACVDFLWPDSRLVLEYDGDVHRTDRDQWQHDIRRRRRIAALGYRVEVVTALDVRSGAVVEIVASALASRSRTVS